MSKRLGFFGTLTAPWRRFAEYPNARLAILGTALILIVRLVIYSGAFDLWAEIGAAGNSKFVSTIASPALAFLALVQFVGFIFLTFAFFRVCRDFLRRRRRSTVAANVCLLVGAYVLSIGPAMSLAQPLHAKEADLAYFMYVYTPLGWCARLCPPIYDLLEQYVLLWVKHK